MEMFISIYFNNLVTEKTPNAGRPALSAAWRGREHAPAGKFAQERKQRKDAKRPVLKRGIAEIYAAASRHRPCAMQVDERAPVFRPPAGARLHFDADRALAAAPDEIDFRSRGRPVVRELAAATRVRDLRAQL